MPTPRDLLNEAKKSIREVEPPDAEQILADGNTVFLDVREPDEYEQGAIPNAVHLPRGHLMSEPVRTRERGSRERTTRVAREQHQLEPVGLDSGHERHARQLLRGERQAVATGRDVAAGGILQPERAQVIAWVELEGVRVAGEVAREAFALDRREPERERPHAAWRGC